MNRIAYSASLAMLTLAAGCATPPLKSSAINLNPKWYWDEAFTSEYGGMEIPQELRHELTVWCFRFLLPAVSDAKFIGIGSGEHPWYKPPCDEVKKALRAEGHDVRPCSDLRFPEQDEMEPDNPGRFRGVEHRETGERVYIYYATIERMISPTLVVVRIGRYNGPLASGGKTYLLQKRDKQWKIFLLMDSFIS